MPSLASGPSRITRPGANRGSEGHSPQLLLHSDERGEIGAAGESFYLEQAGHDHESVAAQERSGEDDERPASELRGQGTERRPGAHCKQPRDCPPDPVDAIQASGQPVARARRRRA